jgi:hypothetical protein
VAIALTVMTCDLYRRNGERSSCAEFAATFMNLNLGERDFVIVHSAAPTMVSVTFASSLISHTSRTD